VSDVTSIPQLHTFKELTSLVVSLKCQGGGYSSREFTRFFKQLSELPNLTKLAVTLPHVDLNDLKEPFACHLSAVTDLTIDLAEEVATAGKWFLKASCLQELSVNRHFDYDADDGLPFSIDHAGATLQLQIELGLWPNMRKFKVQRVSVEPSTTQAMFANWKSLEAGSPSGHRSGSCCRIALSPLLGLESSFPCFTIRPLGYAQIVSSRSQRLGYSKKSVLAESAIRRVDRLAR